MNLRLAFAWVREQMISRAQHRLVVGPARAAEEEAVYEAAVAEVDDLLDPPEVDPEEAAARQLDAWLAAGAEMAEA